MRDGDTMSPSEIDRWAQQLQAQREHKARYKGQPGTPHSIHPQNRRVKRTEKPVVAVQGELRCVHRYRLEEVTQCHYVDGQSFVWGECACGAKKECRVVIEEVTTFHGTIGKGW